MHSRGAFKLSFILVIQAFASEWTIALLTDPHEWSSLACGIPQSSRTILTGVAGSGVNHFLSHAEYLCQSL